MGVNEKKVLNPIQILNHFGYDDKEKFVPVEEVLSILQELSDASFNTGKTFHHASKEYHTFSEFTRLLEKKKKDLGVEEND